MNEKLKWSLAMTGAAVLVVGLLALGGCAPAQEATEEASQQTTAETPDAEEEAAEEMVEFLYVQHADGVTLENGVLTLENIGDEVLYFSDRPHRIVGRQTLEVFLDAWDEGEGSFQEIPPNAVLTVRKEDELRDVVVVLKNPVLTEGTLVYEVEVLDGPEAGKGAFAALFIDVVSVGRPMAGPTSPRGAARRTARRTSRRVNRRQEALDDD